MRHPRLPLITLALVLASCALAAAAAPAVPDAAWILDQVKVLSAPGMEGRASGTPGGQRAAAHVGKVFAEAGLTPAGEGGGFLQPFSVPTGIRLGSPNSLAMSSPAARAFALDADFRPVALSTDGRADGDLLFAGYGITASALGYDDYAGLDAHGKVVLVLTREPRSDDPANPFRRPDAYHYADVNHKVINAREHGARAVLLVSHPQAGDDRLPALTGRSQALGILTLAVTRAAADSLLASAGLRLADLAAAIDGRLAPASRLVTGVSVRLEVALVRERGTTANVIGVLPGTDPRLREQAIVIGAHYDHLGHGGEGSLAPDENGAIHPGADDNASGTAALMALARAFAAAGGAPRSLVFVAFAGEEIGLLGSAHYVTQPAVPLDQTVLMVNLDMVGHLRDEKLYVAGVDSGRGLRDVVTAAARGLPVAPQLRDDPWAPSDHSSFYTAGRPVLFFFTGAHPDYHRPGDTWDKINASGLATATALAARVVAAVAAETTPPQYVRFERPTGERRAGYGPFFGVVPEFGQNEHPGVRVSGVRPGSPAEKCGLQAGDLIVRFAGMSVKTLEDFTFALRGRRAGDRVEVVIARDGQQRTVETTLEERR